MEIKVWLNRLGLGQYEAAFRENAVDFGLLPRLTGDDLKDIGVSAVGHRRILLDAIAELAGPAAETASAGSAAPEAERRQVSVLFADLVGFTRLSAELDPEDVRAVLDSFFALADRAVIDHGGAVDKHIGDCVMGVFGAPVARGNDAERAVRAAVAIRDGASRLAGRAGRPIEVHVGIASGEVMAAAGGGARRDYTVTGDSVNLASRLAGRAEPGEILISSTVHAAVADRFVLADAGRVALKGFAAPVAAWSVQRPASGGSERARPFVGRQAETRQFAAALEGCASSRRGQTILVRGEPGIGKTRLVEEFRRRAVEAGFAAFQGLVLDFGGDNGRAAIASLVRGLIELLLGAGADAAPALDEGLAEQSFEPAERALVLDVLDLELPEPLRSVFEAMDNAARTRHARTATMRLIEQASRRDPLLLIVEDLQWADGATLDIVAVIAETVTKWPALLVATSRLDGDPTRQRWTIPGPLLTLDLAPLPRDDAMALAATYFDTAAAQVEACVRRAAGNPLFLDQLLQHARAKAQIAVPDSVQSLVQARMDQLPHRDRRALQTAAVLGQTFRLDALRHLLDDPAFDPGLLIQRHLVRRQDDGFLFTHALIRDAAYGTLLRERRRELHRRAADWLADGDPVLAAEHLAMAGDPEAPRACLEAAAMLVGRYRDEQALGLIDRGLALAGDGASRIALHLLRGEALLQSGDAAEAEAAFAEALSGATAPRERCRALLGLASARRITDHIDQALADVGEALLIAGREELVEEAARAHALRGNLLFPRGDVEGCFAAHMQSLELARQAGSAELEANALSGIGDAEYLRGRLATAHVRFSECVEMAAAHDLRRIEASNLPMQAITHFWNGEAGETRRLALAAVEAAARIGNERAQMVAHHAGYFACRHLTMRDEAFAHATESLALARRLKAPRFEAEGLAFQAQLMADRGEIEAAREGFAEALAIARASGMAYMGPVFLAGIAQTAPEAAEREAAIEEGEALLSAGSVCHNHLIFRQEMIDLRLVAGDWAGAEHHAGALDEGALMEPSPMADLIVRRGRALAALGRGERRMRGVLERLAEECRALANHHALGAIDRAMEETAGLE